MSCPDCTAAAAKEWHGFSANCKGCAGRSIARIFLRKGEHGRKFRKTCEQFDVTEQQAREAWKADFMAKEQPT